MDADAPDGKFYNGSTIYAFAEKGPCNAEGRFQIDRQYDGPYAVSVDSSTMTPRRRSCRDDGEVMEFWLCGAPDPVRRIICLSAVKGALSQSFSIYEWRVMKL